MCRHILDVKETKQVATHSGRQANDIGGYTFWTSSKRNMCLHILDVKQTKQVLTHSGRQANDIGGYTFWTSSKRYRCLYCASSGRYKEKQRASNFALKNKQLESILPSAAPLCFSIVNTPTNRCLRYDTIRYDTIRYDTIRYDTIKCIVLINK